MKIVCEIFYVRNCRALQFMEYTKASEHKFLKCKKNKTFRKTRLKFLDLRTPSISSTMHDFSTYLYHSRRFNIF